MVMKKKAVVTTRKFRKAGDVVSLLKANFTSKEFNRMISRSGIPVEDKRDLCVSFEALRD